MSELPTSLPARLYLLSYDFDKGKVTGRGHFQGLALRAAALAELLLDGDLHDDAGKAGVRAEHGVDDPILDAVLHDIAASRPRRWKHWVRTGQRRTAREVRDRLATEGLIRVDRHRIFGIFPHTTVTVRDRRAVKRLAHTVTGLARGARPASRADPEEATLAALAVTAELPTVLSWRQRWRHRTVVDDLAAHAGPVVSALRRAIKDAKAAAASGGGG